MIMETVVLLSEAGLSECSQSPTCARDFNRGFTILLLEIGAGYIALVLGIWFLVRFFRSLQSQRSGKPTGAEADPQTQGEDDQP